jgi:hypothetical protein
MSQFVDFNEGCASIEPNGWLLAMSCELSARKLGLQSAAFINLRFARQETMTASEFMGNIVDRPAPIAQRIR